MKRRGRGAKKAGNRDQGLESKEQRLRDHARVLLGRGLSVVVGTAEVVAAVGADELAVVAGESMAAVGADLAMVVDGRNIDGQRAEIIGARLGRAGRHEAERTTL